MFVPQEYLPQCRSDIFQHHDAHVNHPHCSTDKDTAPTQHTLDPLRFNKRNSSTIVNRTENVEQNSI